MYFCRYWVGLKPTGHNKIFIVERGKLTEWFSAFVILGELWGGEGDRMNAVDNNNGIIGNFSDNICLF